MRVWPPAFWQWSGIGCVGVCFTPRPTSQIIRVSLWHHLPLFDSTVPPCLCFHSVCIAFSSNLTAPWSRLSRHSCLYPETAYCVPCSVFFSPKTASPGRVYEIRRPQGRRQGRKKVILACIVSTIQARRGCATSCLFHATQKPCLPLPPR